MPAGRRRDNRGMSISRSWSIPRSRNHRVIAGVIGGIAEHFGVNALPLRLLCLVSSMLLPGPQFVLYLIAWVIMPNPPSPREGTFRR